MARQQLAAPPILGRRRHPRRRASGNLRRDAGLSPESTNRRESRRGERLRARGSPRVSLHAWGSTRAGHETCLKKKRPRRGSARALGEFRSWVATPHRSGAKPSACCCPVARRPARAAVHGALDHLRRESPAGRPETLVGGRCPRIRIHAPRDIASRRSPLHRAFPSVRPHRRARRRVRGRVGRADIRAARARASLQRARGKALDPPRSFESRAEFE